MPDRRPVSAAETACLGAALVLRVGVVAALDPHAWLAGADGPWLIQQGWRIAHEGAGAAPAGVGPLYPLVLAAVWLLFPGHVEPLDLTQIPASYLTILRSLQVGLSLLTIWLVLVLARQLGVGRGPSLVAAGGVALAPAFVIEPFYIRTETLFITLLVAAAVPTVRCVQRRSHAACAACAAGAFAAALAALTRPTALLLPLALAAVVLLARRSRPAARGALIMVAVAALTVAPSFWIRGDAWSSLREGAAANLLLGAHGAGAPLGRPEFHALERDLLARNGTYLSEAAARIAGDPATWLRRRATNLAAAIAQPHGTSDLGGPSRRRALWTWASRDRTAAGLWRLVSTPGFLLRLAVHLFHAAALAGGLAGIVMVWRRRDWWPVYAIPAYLLVVHAVLVATPRYLFPVHAFLWVFAAAALDARLRRRHER